MDNLTHTLAGLALGQAGLKIKTRKGLAALMLGANMPDIDVFFGWVGWPPLAMHRGFTHGLVGGVLIMPLMLAGLLLLLDRWQVGRGTTFKSGLAMHPGWLIALSYLGAISHPLLDLQTTYAVQLLSPFSNAWYHMDSLFIIDVWVWSAFGLTIAWSRWREKHDREWRQPVQAVIAAFLVYVSFNAGLSQTAREAVARRSPSATAIFASPPPVFFWQRSMSWRAGRSIGRAEFRPFGGGLMPDEQLQPDGMDDPIVRQTLAQRPALRRFLGWSILPIATVERSKCKATVSIGDGRYLQGGSRRSRLERQIVTKLPGPGC
ncbi:metal-dependent hydrolase [Sphingomonas sp.]|uniref:metal-dependent hydrolase n=1 Tax=Sphingomonas sp. TaxID=28214 RepID=UPI00286A031A|nr:metal-dependent hydrolase [Sphingomonas sp.]